MKLFLFATAVLLSTHGFLSVSYADTDPQTAHPHLVPSSVTAVTDPAYAGMAYDRPKFVPPDGTFLLIGGQDKVNIAEIPGAWGVRPAGYASYFAVSSSNSIWSDETNGGDPANIQNSKWIADTHPHAVLQMAMWMVGYAKGWGNYSENAVNGVFDDSFESFCLFAKTVKRPIFLRIGYEFDGRHNMLEPEEYVAAYRYIVDFIRSRGVSNVAFVWHSYISTPYEKWNVTNWYPGDDYVDWFGMSVFRDHVFYGRYSRFLDPFVDFARARKKPVMIAESCPSGGISKKGYETWNRWFVPYFDYIHRKNIKAFSYINCDWDLVEQFKNDHWRNTRIQDYPPVLVQWTNEIHKDKYLKESPDTLKLIGFTNAAR